MKIDVLTPDTVVDIRHLGLSSIDVSDDAIAIGATVTNALESAIDELSYTLNIDPIELRVKNHAHMHPDTGLRWSRIGQLSINFVSLRKLDRCARDPLEIV
jgi:hypothetical protein